MLPSLYHRCHFTDRVEIPSIGTNREPCGQLKIRGQRDGTARAFPGVEEAGVSTLSFRSAAGAQKDQRAGRRSRTGLKAQRGDCCGRAAGHSDPDGALNGSPSGPVLFRKPYSSLAQGSTSTASAFKMS